MNSKNRAPEHTGLTIGLVLWVTVCVAGLIHGLISFLLFPSIFNILLELVTIFLLCFGVRRITFSRSRRDHLYNICQNPSEQSAKAYLEFYRQRRPKFYGEANYPDNWNKLREYWYKINGSNKIPTYLKAEILETFKKDGLFVKDTIVDNYNE